MALLRVVRVSSCVRTSSAKRTPLKIQSSTERSPAKMKELRFLTWFNLVSSMQEAKFGGMNASQLHLDCKAEAA